jgi:hypothetical protein
MWEYLPEATKVYSLKVYLNVLTFKQIMKPWGSNLMFATHRQASIYFEQTSMLYMHKSIVVKTDISHLPKNMKSLNKVILGSRWNVFKWNMHFTFCRLIVVEFSCSLDFKDIHCNPSRFTKFHKISLLYCFLCIF